ncbi:hypothetical protein JCGZ_07508 [Jatropha curcas]|uniref:Protein kinase domain-containing protein n=1 Tax=Jatropha curcas TaxID=180498 RepID=A0A067KCR7_JATCU|nr:hypothetical protein JCGZ_07508 [Jatropha curcas]
MTVVRLLVLLFLFILSFCNLSSSLSENEALVKFKESLTNAEALDDWVSGPSPCEEKWVGVVCFDGTITGLHLSNLGLSGTIDVEALQELPGLRTTSFINNSFTGPIPAFNKIGALKSLLLSHNGFSGEIANDFFAPMLSLKKVWLSDNKFTGKIPESVMQLKNLKELHLEGNQFSGPIPPLNQAKQVITSLDLSNNKLEGEIPSSFSTFSADSFANNDKLCGQPLHVACSSSTPSLAVSLPNSSSSSSSAAATSVASSSNPSDSASEVMYTLCSPNGRHKDDDFSMLEKENLDEVVLSVRASGSNKRQPSDNSRRSTSSTRRGPHQGRNGMGDLIMINDERGTFGLQDLMKAAAEVLGSGGLGSAYKAMLTSGVSVVVKRIREMNMLSRDGFDAEMRKFGRIRHKNILTPLAYHFRKEEKLMVTEYMPKGSLLYVIHGDRGICHSELNWENRLKIIKGIANGLSFLHTEYSTYNLPHGNLKSSNVVLDDDYEPLLTDYALDPLTNPNHSAQTMFAYKSPEYLLNHQVSAKSDVFCLGIIILEVVTGKFPSQYLANGKGGTDVVKWVQRAKAEGKEQEVIDPEIANGSSAESIQEMVKLLRIGAACAESNTALRLDMKEAIRRIGEVKV